MRGSRRIIAILTGAVVACNSAGDAFLRLGLGAGTSAGVGTAIAYLQSFLRASVISGVALLLSGFLLELSLLSRADLTFVRPLTSTTYVVVTLIGAFALNEHVSTAHWWGVMLILCGVVVVGKTRPLTSRDAK